MVGIVSLTVALMIIMAFMRGTGGPPDRPNAPQFVC